MNYRKLGQSGLKVSEISLGSWLTYGNYIDRQKTSKIIHRAYELGVNFFDTANMYERGGAESLFGEIIQDFPRQSLVIATKVYWPMGEWPNDKGLSRKHIIEQVEASLKRLRVDYIDVYYFHGFDSDTPIEESLRAINDLITQGKIHYFGVSNWTATQIQETFEVIDRYNWNRLIVNQPKYNLLNREIEKEVIPTCHERGISQVVYSPLAQGVLTGKYTYGKDAPKNSRSANPLANRTIQQYMRKNDYERIENFSNLAKELGISLTHLSLAWILSNPNIASAIVGASNIEQIETNLQATEIKLPKEILDRLNNL
ncbi:aldo/keto reductase family protein [Bacillus sp. CGMCC 1.16607]|uniref:aldo/keto reductase family protein n=1 Tax=Bacillus sp. CGMCC 1.16607 TaxID=3351842 RepID=UPI0036350189